MPPRRRAVQHEKIVQEQGEKLLASVGALKIYRFGTRRAVRCWNCKEVSKDLGTRQTPGIADVLAFLPEPRYRPGHAAWCATQRSINSGPVCDCDKPRLVHDGVPKIYGVFWEAKRDEKRTPSDDQIEFMQLCVQAEWLHVGGGLDSLFAFLIKHGWLHPKNVPHYRLPPQGTGTAHV